MDQPPVKYTFEFTNGMRHIVLFTFSIIKCVTRQHMSQTIYEEYLELRIWMYEWVRRRTFHNCALRGANDENRIGGWSTLGMICMLGNIFALLNGC